MEARIPLGNDFLKGVREIENRCQAELDNWSSTTKDGTSRTISALGTAFSYLNQIASCFWGCRGGDHAIEYMIGRALSNGLAAMRLLRAGYYDESFGLIRQIGENANLFCLFLQSPKAYAKWRTADERQRQNEFRPVAVRLQLEKLDLPMPMDQDLYRLLSGLSVHLSPDTRPQLHNPFGQPTMGGYFQSMGVIVALNHLADMTAYILGFSSILLKEPSDRRIVIDAMIHLGESTSEHSLLSIEESWAEIQDDPQYEQRFTNVRRRQNQIRMAFTELAKNRPTLES